jgi:hypothetical protein
MTVGTYSGYTAPSAGAELWIASGTIC